MSFKIPLDAYILAVPVAFSCVAMTVMIYNTMRNDPDQSTISFYDQQHQDQELDAAKRYHDNPTKRYFDARVTGRQTWGFFENDFSKH